ncbi:MAG: acyltransferase [Betaproteobacteria bacterium]
MDWFRAWMHRGAPFDPRGANNFDLLRFVAASLVLIDHCYALTGRAGRVGPFGYESLGGFAVAVFFVISGFLVAGSWQRAPHLLAFVAKRVLRIFPAYAVVVAVCALVLGPLLSDFAPRAYFRHDQTWVYFRNLTFVELHYSLPNVFATNPYPHAVNGSIWTLPTEVAMYVALAVLGCIGLMRRSFVTILAATLAIGWFGWTPELRAAPPLYFKVLLADYTVHLALWFFLGSTLWVWRDRIRYRSDAAVALVALLWATEGTPAGLVLLHGAVPYLVIWTAGLPVGWMNRFGRRGDFSYGMYLYAFPVQQTLAMYGGARWPIAVYFAASFVITLVCAVASWYCVEHPALRAKQMLRRFGGRTIPAEHGPPDAGLIPRKAAGPGGP